MAYWAQPLQLKVPLRGTLSPPLSPPLRSDPLRYPFKVPLEGTLEGTLQGLLKVPLRYPSRYPLSLPLSPPLRSPLRYPCQRGLKMTDFPHLFCHFLLFHFSNSSHLGPSVSPPLASFSHLSPAYSLASYRQQDSVGHSGPLGPWLPPLSSLRPSRSFRPTRSMACFSLSLASVQLGLSRSFRPTQSLAASVLVFTSLLCFSTTALTQSVIPAHSVFGNFLALPCFCPPPFSFTWEDHFRETVFSIFSDPENGSILKHRPIWIIRKILCV